MPQLPGRAPSHADNDDADDDCFDLDRLSRYAGLSVSTLRRYLRDPSNPLPHHMVRPAGKARGRLFVSKREFDAWVRSFPGTAAPAPTTDTPAPADVDVSWVRRAFRK